MSGVSYWPRTDDPSRLVPTPFNTRQLRGAGKKARSSVVKLTDPAHQASTVQKRASGQPASASSNGRYPRQPVFGRPTGKPSVHWTDQATCRRTQTCPRSWSGQFDQPLTPICRQFAGKSPLPQPPRRSTGPDTTSQHYLRSIFLPDTALSFLALQEANSVAVFFTRHQALFL
jgi:hypothetical protein